ncbi:MAG: NAD(P)/FAD-dependent oxidoreductase [Acidimicrobiia bacterium]|nr:NAD(P)/FAD-dependent oxidoreductase [Acidimicrobiia bacterium]
MPRTPLGSLLRQLHAETTFSRRTGIPAIEIHRRRSEMSRRRFLAASIGAGAATLLTASGCSSSSSSTSSPSAGAASSLRVTVVGSGLAGLVAAYRLSQAGAAVTVHESARRVGGRTRTVRGFFDDDRTAESGGEFVNSDHDALRSLVRELGLGLEDTWDGYPAGTGPVSSFDGMPYRAIDVVGDWSAVAPAVQRDYAAAGTDIRWDHHDEAAVALDRMTLAEWIDVNVPGGRPSRLGRLIEVTHLSEWGGAAEDQSALNFITTVGPGAGGSMDLLGGSDERWHIDGGNDQVAQRLVERIGPAAVQLESSLVAVRRQGSGVRCTFDHGASTTDTEADGLVLALPFTALRTVDLAAAELSDRKRRVIDEQPMGTNAKLHLEFAERAWRADGADGDSVSDTELMVTWEEVITEPGPTGLLVAFTGGAPGAGYDFPPAHGEAPSAIVAATASDLETVFGSATPAAATGRGWLDSWVDDPHTGGSYSYWAPGQYTDLRGAGGTAEGPIHFCGEHTSLQHQGFMNGAVETGERAAAEILDR